MPVITVRITEEEKSRLDAAARRERLLTGNPISNSDVVREALKTHLDKQEVRRNE